MISVFMSLTRERLNDMWCFEAASDKMGSSGAAGGDHGTAKCSE